MPLTAETYWALRQRKHPTGGVNLEKLRRALPRWRAQAAASPLRRGAGRRVLLFSMLNYWTEHAALLGLALAGLGHRVTLACLPYANWQKPLDRFDRRRQDAYTRSVLRIAEPLMEVVSFLPEVSAALPDSLQRELDTLTLQDAQYTLQVEEVDPESPLYRLRSIRNRHAAQAAWAYIGHSRPDVLITPNGSILEFGAVYRVARYLGIPAVTYEFGEQRERIWFAQNGEVMQQETDEMWAALGDIPLTEAETRRVRELFTARQKGSLWENFARRWQGVPSEGGERARAALGLDSRPVALLAANVIGDSLTLGREVFSESMTEWLRRTVRYFAEKPQAQLVVRIHPGEQYTQGPSVADVVRAALPSLPEHIRLVEARDPVNTYDLVQIADLGLVYTTTVGMEMAMSGVPVIVAGKTHYRGKGFTLDPDTWDAYFEQLASVLAAPQDYRPAQEQVELAWRYASRFFFDYPMPFPWHLLHMDEDLSAWPLERFFGEEGQSRFAETFACLTGEPRSWMVDGGRRTTDDRRRATDNGRRTTDNGRRTTGNGRRTTDDRRQTNRPGD